MQSEPAPLRGSVDGVSFTLKPEWLAGKTWWRIFVGTHPKALVRYPEYGLAAAEALAADEARFRREATARPDAPAATEPAAPTARERRR